jgi:hypothetical protein
MHGGLERNLHELMGWGLAFSFVILDSGLGCIEAMYINHSVEMSPLLYTYLAL